jgi:glycerol kinase
MSGLATHFFESIEEIQAISKKDKSFSPNMTKEKRQKLYKNWVKAVEATRKFT